MSPSVDVEYAGNMKPGRWLTGEVDMDAPTTPVQPFARALRITEVIPYTDDSGRECVRLIAGALGDLFPLPIGSRVLLIRGVS